MKNMRNGLLALALIIVVALIIVGIMFTRETSDQDADTTDVVTIDDQATEEETTVAGLSQELSAGAKARQIVFDALEQEFPTKEKFTYTILPDGTTDPELPPAEAYMWDLIAQMAPSTDVLNSIVAYTVYYDEDDTTDASVTLFGDTDDTFVFELNFSAANDFELLIPVLVHEFSHVLSLKDDQITSELEDENVKETCTLYLVDEGCLLSDSYLNPYYEQFWKGNADYQKEDRAETETEAFYETRKDAYVTDYATTNPIEDFAESFMYFTTKDPIDSDTVKGKKVNFFTQFPELVAYKNSVRSKVSAWAN